MGMALAIGYRCCAEEDENRGEKDGVRFRDHESASFSVGRPMLGFSSMLILFSLFFFF